MDTDNLIVYTKDWKSEDFFLRHQKRHWKKTWYIKLWNRQTSTKLIELMKDELGGKIMARFIRLRPKMYSYLIDDVAVIK